MVEKLTAEQYMAEKGYIITFGRQLVIVFGEPANVERYRTYFFARSTPDFAEFADIYNVHVNLNRAPDYYGDPESQLQLLAGEAVAKKFGYEIESDKHQSLVVHVATRASADRLVEAVQTYHRIVTSEQFRLAVAAETQARHDFQKVLEDLLK